MATKSVDDSRQSWLSVIVHSFLFVSSGYWLFRVNDVQPIPYLDEVFHVRQAQAYCDQRWDVWDPKITTPPGLYVAGLLVTFYGGQCEVKSLRVLNVAVISGLLPIELRTLFRLLKKQRQRQKTGRDSSPEEKEEDTEPSLSLYDFHSILNICLFPALFFFSALFYTDVLSAYFVLRTYSCHLRIPPPPLSSDEDEDEDEEEQPLSIASLRKSWSAIAPQVWLIWSGIQALLFRQTNIFWVAIFLGGLEVVRTVKRCGERWQGASDASLRDVVVRSWERSEIWDRGASEAGIEDYVKTSLSLAAAAAANFRPVLIALIPYFALLDLFAGFVLWNGGVVLGKKSGDKSNHIATLHLPQLLYLFPYMTFFSLPLLLPFFLTLIPQSLIPSTLAHHLSLPTPPRPRPSTFLLFVALALPTIALNTIIHPFTLADNRHYVFYVFRILRRWPVLRYAAAPVYFVCAWGVLVALGGSAGGSAGSGNGKGVARERIGKKDGKGEKGNHTEGAGAEAGAGEGEEDGRNVGSNTTSFTIIYLAATTLSLITAPLVEPRYFILPWMLWRLHLPSSSPSPSPSSTPSSSSASGPPSKQSSSSPSHSSPSLSSSTHLSLILLAETLWHLSIDAWTAYMFLHRPFTWAQSPGEVQRFLW
ncbi:MAG: hypothetical protein M1819_003309 [Sarea resinae]|nr:MAG: hypothetical protein M1819_003309 [Sarea resinae]